MSSIIAEASGKHEPILASMSTVIAEASGEHESTAIATALSEHERLVPVRENLTLPLLPMLRKGLCACGATVALFAVVGVAAALRLRGGGSLPVVTTVGAPYTRSLVSAAAGVTWRLHNANGSIDVPANVPTVAHEALLSAGILRGDPLYRFHEREWAWVAHENWTFVATFTLCVTSDADDCAVLASDGVMLRLEGVDTVALISLNGEPIGSTASVFVRHDLPVKPQILRRGEKAGEGRGGFRAQPVQAPGIWNEMHRELISPWLSS